MKTHNVNPPQVFNYMGNEITFLNGESVKINATDMARSFGKEVRQWFDNVETHAFIHALADHKGLLPQGLPTEQKRTSLNTSALADIYPSLITVIRGGVPGSVQQGTWMHEDLAIEFARWLSPKFAIWCNDKIKELLTKGSAHIQSLPNFNNPAEAARAWADVYEKKLQLEERTELQQKELQIAAPKVDYYENVLSSKTTYSTNQIAKELGMSAISLNKRLHQLGVQYKQGGTWLLYAKYQNKGYTKTNTHWYNTNSGEKGTSMQTVWFEKGREFIHEIIAKHGRTKTIPVSE